MRAVLMAGVVMSGALALAGCEPERPARAAAQDVIAQTQDPGADWPLLLAHCLRSPSCDPRSNFGQGEGQASGLSGAVSWFAVNADKVSEGGEDYGASLLVSSYGARGGGGDGGRSLTLDELPDSLGMTNARRSTLTIEYRAPGDGKPEPYALSFRSAWVELADRALEEAVIEIKGEAGVLLSAQGGMMDAAEEAGMPNVKPVTVQYYRNLRDEPLQALVKALMAGESLSLKITTPAGATILGDTIYAVGYEGAARLGADSLKDPEIAKTVTARCARFKEEPDSFWKIADVTPALMVCDPRTVEQRR